MTLLTTATLILGSCATPATPTDFQARLHEAMTDLAAPVLIAEDQTTVGRIDGFSEESKTFDVMDDEGNAHTFTWNEKTTWTLDGEKSTQKDALAAGRHASVKHDDAGLASRVEVTSK